jgi:Holliday junction resolvasome RuvABC ATP-dependent DNA helicase subunit
MFETLVGQKPLKKKLQFYKESCDATQKMPFLFFVGAKGLGKTEFAKQLAKEIKNADGSRRPFLEINCSTLKRVDDFFEQVFLPLIYDNEVTVLFDEAHELPKGLTNAFLTIFNTEKDHLKDFNYNDQVFTFNFKKQSFFFATTESDKVFAPLRDRLVTVDFEPYSQEELGEIVKLNCPDIDFEPEALSQIARISRGNARSVVQHATNHIIPYCKKERKQYFNSKDFEKLKNDVGINPLGLTNVEKEILKILKHKGSCSLNMLSAKTGMSRTALQRDHEMYLIKRNLIEIDGQRKITEEGTKLIAKLV